MVADMLKTVSSKALLWLLILSALYSASCILNMKHSTRFLVKTSDMDSTVFAIWCQFVCLVLTALLFHWQLVNVDADKTSLLKSWVTTAAFMIVSIPLITRACLNLGFHIIIGKDIDWIRPVVLKWTLAYSVFTLYLMFRQMSLVTASWFRALKVVVFLLTVWCCIVFLMTCCYLRLGIHRMFTHTETLVDVTETSYGHLLLASFLIFLVVDYNRNHQTVTPQAAVVQTH